MKEDYLWDQTGEDAEIEHLENVLQAFRSRENAPPWPENVRTLEETKPRRFFQFGLAFASGLALVVISLGVWSQFFNYQKQGENNLAGTNAVPDNKIRPAKTDVDDPDKVPVQITTTPAPPIKQKTATVRRPVPAVVRQNKRSRPDKQFTVQTVRLTKEEKYAYDQLMLALSITSSNLKLVKDKVEGVEEKTAVFKNGK